MHLCNRLHFLGGRKVILVPVSLFYAIPNVIVNEFIEGAKKPEQKSTLFFGQKKNKQK